MSSTQFARKKRKILEQLSSPEEQYTDLSPKGSVDTGVRELIDEINAKEDYVTTSSCAGRVSIFLDAPPSSANLVTERGGKGPGGAWLYISHDPVDLEKCSGEGELLSLLGFGRDGIRDIGYPESELGTRFVHFKFEPMILHILTSTPSAAQHALGAAMNAGFRESGISGITHSTASSTPTPMVAVRSAGLAFGSIIGFSDPSDGSIVPMVSEAYLRMLVRVANQRFVANEERRARFRVALQARNAGSHEEAKAEWEPADVRSERKRAEGLRRREAIKQSLSNDNHDDDDESDVGTDMLIA